MSDLFVRAHETADRHACFSLFDGNSPDFFADAKRNDFIDFANVTQGNGGFRLSSGTAE
ncbi:hypothetical protein NZL82_08540 [Sphingomonas sanguinis]|uniref:hypothetical protein n=1 Tax=Sphingomonas sp. LC-1 TaxID=3110957 RepID=UPI0021BB7381|nr:hypothetical protein [Sphingomonas sp. LC-1]MCT8001930.1 hypothetical protein [Sphingomonas sp. LC-1]